MTLKEAPQPDSAPASDPAASPAAALPRTPDPPRRRAFELERATRESAPLLLGLTGPSGSGKTFSALRLATGIAGHAKACGSPGQGIVVIDTENRRARHYAGAFSFTHIDFAPPFGSLDYLDALHAAAAVKPAVIIVDSLSHEHDGEGGMLDAVTAELDRIAGQDPIQQQKLAAAAWRRPKTHRRALLSGLFRLKTHLILCMRASERSRLQREPLTQEPTDMGFTPVAGPEFLFELTACMLLKPGAQGTPTWSSTLPGEQTAIKLPRQFEGVFAKAEPLSEAHGVDLARWAAGETILAAPARQRQGRRRRAT